MRRIASPLMFLLAFVSLSERAAAATMAGGTAGPTGAMTVVLIPLVAAYGAMNCSPGDSSPDATTTTQ